MTQVEVSLCDQDYRSPFPERSISVETDSGKELKNVFLLGSREERVSLLKAGFTGKDIESEYLRLNGIVIISMNRI